MSDFNAGSFQEVEALPPERVRHHLLQFDQAIGHALVAEFECDKYVADNLVNQAHLLGFESLAEALSDALAEGRSSSEGTRGSAEVAIAKAKLQIRELLQKVETNSS